MSDPRPATRNVTKAFRLAAATPQLDGTIAGQRWYNDAHNLACELAEGRAHGERWLGWENEVERAAAVIAVLSPRLSWAKNVKCARMAYRLAPKTLPTGRDTFVAILPVLNANADKAWRILSGEDPDVVVSGPKVRAFWRTIIDPSDPRSVVVDRHAIDVALGTVTDDATRGRVVGKVGAYDTIATCYRRAAGIISRERGELWTPAMVQAVTWTYWREHRAAANHGAGAGR